MTIKEIKCNNLRRLFYKFNNVRHISYTEFGKMLNERSDVIGKLLSEKYEISDEKIISWCKLQQLPFSYFYEEHKRVHWPPEKISYSMMSDKDRLAKVAEDYTEYAPGTRKVDKLVGYMRLLHEEMQRVVPKEVLEKSQILTRFIETFEDNEKKNKGVK